MYKRYMNAIIIIVIITRVLGMGMPKTRGCPYHRDIALDDKRLVPIPTVT